MAYTLSDIKLEISKRVADPDGIRTGTRTESYFLEELSNAVAQIESPDVEAPELITEVSHTVTSGYSVLNSSDIGSLIKFIGVSLGDSSDHYLSMISNNEFDVIRNNTKLHPYSNEAIYTFSTHLIKFFSANDQDDFSVNVKIVKNPNSSLWLTNDLVYDLKYSQRLILMAIEKASERLRLEIQAGV